MATEIHQDEELVARLKRLDAAATVTSPGFGYDGMFERHGAAARWGRFAGVVGVHVTGRAQRHTLLHKYIP